jgi:hypothetical protein
MNPARDLYQANPHFWNLVIALLIFGGMARIAFWRNDNGLRVGGPLAVGLMLLLTFALLTWADESGWLIKKYGGWAALLIAEAVLILAINAWRKSKRE